MVVLYYEGIETMTGFPYFHENEVTSPLNLIIPSTPSLQPNLNQCGSSARSDSWSFRFFCNSLSGKKELPIRRLRIELMECGAFGKILSVPPMTTAYQDSP